VLARCLLGAAQGPCRTEGVSGKLDLLCSSRGLLAVNQATPEYRSQSPARLICDGCVDSAIVIRVRTGPATSSAAADAARTRTTARSAQGREVGSGIEHLEAAMAAHARSVAGQSWQRGERVATRTSSFGEHGVQSVCVVSMCQMWATHKTAKVWESIRL
jgi:hypothetical protein